MIVAAEHTVTKEPVIRETRSSQPLRAVPRWVKEEAEAFVTTNTWHPHYQQFFQGQPFYVECWKCGRTLLDMQPALVMPPGGKRAGQAKVATYKGMVLGRPLPFNHYREGEFWYRLRGRTIQDKFSFLHCADCQIDDADGSALLVCHLVGLDEEREAVRKLSSLNAQQDDEWAQFMWRRSLIELDKKAGPSIGPQDLMRQAGSI